MVTRRPRRRHRLLVPLLLLVLLLPPASPVAGTPVAGPSLAVAAADRDSSADPEAAAPTPARQFRAILAGRRTPARGLATFELNGDGGRLAFTLAVTAIRDVVGAELSVRGPGRREAVVARLYGPARPGGGPKSGILARGALTGRSLLGPLRGRPLSELVAAMRTGRATVTLRTAAPARAAAGPAEAPEAETLAAAVTIPSIGIAFIADAEGFEGELLTFTVVIQSVVVSPVPPPGLVSFRLSPGTARPGEDYADLTGAAILVPPGGTVSERIRVPALVDFQPERPEFFFVYVVPSPWVIPFPVRPSARGTIHDQPALSIDDVRQPEGTAPGQTKGFEFSVTLDQPVHRPVFVEFATVDGSAVAGRDYVPTRGGLTFAAGEERRTISVPVAMDADEEPEESFKLVLEKALILGSETRPRIVKGEGVGTIIDDDGSRAVVRFSEPSNNAEGQPLTFRVFLQKDPDAPGPVSHTVTVDYATEPGVPPGCTWCAPATPGADYVPTSGRLVFAPGETEKEITVQTIHDRVPEREARLPVPSYIGPGVESVVMRLSNPNGATIGGAGWSSTVIVDADQFTCGDGDDPCYL